MPGSRRKGPHPAVLCAGAALLVALVAQLGIARVGGLLSTLGANFFVIVALFGCHECVRALAVGRCLPPDRRPRYHRLLQIRFLGEAVGAVTRTGIFGAEPARAWMLAGQTGRGSHAYAAAVSELLANSSTSAFVSVAVTGVLLRRGHVHGPILVVCHVLLWSSLVYFVAAVWTLSTRARLIGAVLRGIATLPLVGRRLRTDPARLRAIEDAIGRALTDRPGALLQVLLLECIAQAILISEIYWTLRSMGVPLDVKRAIAVEVLTKAGNIFQFVGVTEAGYSVLFRWLGMTALVGFTLSLVKLVRSVAAAGLGLAVLRVAGHRDARTAGRDRRPADRIEPSSCPSSPVAVARE